MIEKGSSRTRLSTSQFCIFYVLLPLIMKNVFEKLALYRRRGASTSLVNDWLKVILRNCDIILKISEVC